MKIAIIATAACLIIATMTARADYMAGAPHADPMAESLCTTGGTPIPGINPCPDYSHSRTLLGCANADGSACQLATRAPGCIQDCEHNWHVLAVADSGTVTILKNLTKHEADYTAARLQGLPATPAEVKLAAQIKVDDELAIRVEKRKEDEKLRKLLGPCPMAGEMDSNNPVWAKYLKTSHSVEVSRSIYGIRTVDGCISPDGKIQEFGWGSSGAAYSGTWGGFGVYVPANQPWTKHPAMKLVEVFQ